MTEITEKEKEYFFCHHDIKSGNLIMVDRSLPTYICRKCGGLFRQMNGHLVPVYKHDNIYPYHMY